MSFILSKSRIWDIWGKLSVVHHGFWVFGQEFCKFLELLGFYSCRTV